MELISKREIVVPTVNSPVLPEERMQADSSLLFSIFPYFDQAWLG